MLKDCDFAFTFDDFMLVPIHSTIKSRKEPNTSSKIGKDTLLIPIIAAPMNTVTEYKMSQTMTNIGADSVLHRYMSIEEQCEQLSRIYNHQKPWVAIGATGDFLERAQELYKKGARKFCVDVANGHSEICGDAVLNLRKSFANDDCSIMAGNVCTAEGVRNLEVKGANVIRVGIGSGAVCTTRLVTGFGVPQLSAISWCSEAVESATIVADGGVRSSGDIVKSLAIGADAVMIGGLLAGTDQTPGEVRKDFETGSLYKYYHGMASVEGRQEWFSKDAISFVPEGASTRVIHKGDAKKVIEGLVGGLKVGMSFCNARDIKELRQNAKWVRVTENGRTEGTQNRRMFKG